MHRWTRMLLASKHSVLFEPMLSATKASQASQVRARNLVEFLWFVLQSLFSPRSLGCHGCRFFLTLSKAARRSLWLFWWAMIFLLISFSCASASWLVTTCTSPEIQEIHPAMGSLIRALVPWTSFTRTLASASTMPTCLDCRDFSLRTMAGTVVQTHPGWISSIFAGKLASSERMGESW